MSSRRTRAVMPSMHRHGASQMEHHERDHHSHHAMMAQDFKKRTIVNAILALPVLLLSPAVQRWLGLGTITFPGSKWLLFLLSSIIVFYGAKPFYTGARSNLKSGILGMPVLVSLAVLSGYLYSVGATFFFTATDFYWEISTLVLFLTFGHWMEMRAVQGASGALGELVKLIPPRANLIRDGRIVQVKTSALKKGDILLIRPGEKIPIDGKVISGESSVDESLITGESKPVSKHKGAPLVGGSINGQGSLRMRVEKTGEKTALAQIIKLVSDAQSSKPKTQKLADRAAHYLTLIAIIVGIGTFLFWTLIKGTTLLFALTLTITVIVITCPHALGLAIPTVTSITTTLAARNGILIKDMDALERSKKIDLVIFDKTGTLTRGAFGVTEIERTGSWDKKDILRYSAALEEHSEHVIAKGIREKAKQERLKAPSVTNFKALPGKGARATHNGKSIHIGNLTLMKELKIDTSKARKRADQLSKQGKTVIYLSEGKKLQGLIALADQIREESKQAVKNLRDQDIQVAMLTGDNKATAKRVAKELGLDTYFAEVSPEDKIKTIKDLQKKGKLVAMVGDGINDAPALTQADVGIAIGAGTDVAIQSAQIVLIKDNPQEVAKLIKLSKLTMRKMKENLAWATGYNLIAIPIAAGALSRWGILLRPEWGALIMAASSIIVVANALLLKTKSLDSPNT